VINYSELTTSFTVAESQGENMKREQIKGLSALGLCRGLTVAGV
jgi:hypothetical protein